MKRTICRLIREEAYHHACETACNRDCYRYRAGTCKYRHDTKTMCYLFKEEMDMAVLTIVREWAIGEKQESE